MTELSGAEATTCQSLNACEARHNEGFTIVGEIVAVEKLAFPPKRPNLGDRICLREGRTPFIRNPDAILFLRISRKRVFQEPRLFTTVASGQPSIAQNQWRTTMEQNLRGIVLGVPCPQQRNMTLIGRYGGRFNRRGARSATSWHTVARTSTYL
jgi:hypothetical protein